MERLVPGVHLEELPDDRQATVIAAALMRRLWRPVSTEGDLIPLEKWTAGLKRLRAAFDSGSGPFPEEMVRQAPRGCSPELNGSATENALLHGDLHYWNILSAESEPWLAIDPKGVVGDPAFEPAAWLLNPKPRDLAGRASSAPAGNRRLDQFAGELGLARERMLAWGYAQAVLSAWWSYEDHGRGWEHALAIAEALSG